MNNRITETASDSACHDLDVVELLARLPQGWKRTGQELAGPCPECGGKDRCFSGKELQFAHCRQCSKNFNIGQTFLGMEAQGGNGAWHTPTPEIMPFNCAECGEAAEVLPRAHGGNDYHLLGCTCGDSYSDLLGAAVDAHGQIIQQFEVPAVDKESGETADPMDVWRFDPPYINKEGEELKTPQTKWGNRRRGIWLANSPHGAGSVLYLVEGEKAGLAMLSYLWQMGLEGIVGSWGAATYAKKCPLPALPDVAKIIVCPDNDPPNKKLNGLGAGEHWAKVLAGRFQDDQNYAGLTVQITAHLEDAPFKFDVADMSGTALTAHLDSAVEYVSAEPEPVRRKSARRKALEAAGAVELDRGPSAENFERIAKDIGLQFRYDDMRGIAEWKLDNPLPGIAASADFEEWDDLRMARLFEHIRSHYYRADDYGRVSWLNFGTDGVGRQSILAALQPNRFNPFLEYLKGCEEAEGSPALSECLEAWGGDANDDFQSWVSEALFLGPIQRALNPGCQIRTFPLLIGDPGIGKSAFLREMLPPNLQGYYSDSLALSMRAQERTEATYRNIIVELGELRGISKAQAGEVKAWLTSTVDSARPAYSRPGTWPRKWFLIATMNPTDAIPSDPGILQRFACLPLRRGPAVELYLERWRESFWAQSYRMYLDGERVSRVPNHLEAAQGAAIAAVRCER